MTQFKIFRVSASVDNTDEQFFKWELFVHATSVQDAYSKLEQFDKECADFISCEDDLYIVNRMSEEMFELVEPAELPF